MVLLNNSEEFSREQEEAYQWLSSLSRRMTTGIPPEIAEEAAHDWIEKLLDLPFHVRMQKLGATPKAVRDRAYDMWKKGGKHKQVSLDHALEATMPGEWQKTPDKMRELLATEGIQRLKAKRPEVEAALSEGIKRKREEIGKRRFKVMELKLQTELTAEEIGEKLGVSSETIDDDWVAFKKSQERIQEILFD